MQDLAQVSQEVAKMVENMNVGEISRAFTMINDKGKEVCAIVKLKSRINGHKATNFGRLSASEGYRHGKTY